MRLLRDLDERTEVDLAGLVEADVLAVGEIDDPLPRAFTTQIGTGYAILLHSGLRNMVYRTARAVSTRTRAVTSKDRPLTVEFEDSCRILAEVFWWFQEAGQPFGPQYDIDEEQLLFAHTIAHEAELFVLAHELGHVFADPETFARFSDRPSESFQLHRDEFDADRVALGFTLGRFRTTSSELTLEPKHVRAYAGAEFFMLMLAGLEAVGVQPASSHPPAAERLANLRRTAESWCGDSTIYAHLRTFAADIDTLFLAMLKTVREPDRIAAFTKKAAASVIAELNDLLARCVGDVVPDYWTFQGECPRIFNKGYSLQLLEEVAATATRFVEDLRKYNEEAPNPSTTRQVKESFHKFKLLFSAVPEMPEPARGLFKRALELPHK